MNPETHTIDAKDRVLGRVATEVAVILRGKNSPNFEPNIAPKAKVKILNIDKIKLSGNKLEDKNYKSYSGYPGGQKTVLFKTMFDKDPEKTFKKVVKGMLPKNKLRKEILKNLTVE